MRLVKKFGEIVEHIEKEIEPPRRKDAKVGNAEN
jgi:hypothetical protein